MAMNEAAAAEEEEEEESRYGIYMDKSEPKDKNAVVQDIVLRGKDGGEHLASNDNDVETGGNSRDGGHFFEVYPRPYSEHN
jgi:hypothetical protein